MAQDWSLKGAGAANLVYAYCGEDERLSGHVLRVRKGTAHAASEVDIALWEGVLVHKPGDAAGRELSYVADVMAPLLGRQYVFPGIPCRLPVDMREAMRPGGSSDHFPALLQPDHTLLQAADERRERGRVPCGVCRLISAAGTRAPRYPEVRILDLSGGRWPGERKMFVGLQQFA
ncbi:hypothetical protein CHLRE_04g229100v5 [Chlamydomonas reinhardtii]|uniref:Inositol-pentakisphosphate 2-kinase n=1 Tax=Chlamydomonas reinhardtii TaxID=3055 RepID=A0A2K3DUT7_CHLRE|nr:uncharacterized protein CHLRE_04g229100v5 [Chlamydomonas reinhardtii]PNW84307.1 hypothetical protein CHLRE_04g229100v5 [Chlamydomonas reinhardtii]